VTAEQRGRMSAIAREMRTQSHSVQDTLDTVVSIAVELFEGCDEAAITVMSRRNGGSTPAATGARARAGDELQYELKEGPCLDAAWNSELVASDDLRHDERWPRWGPLVARRHGINSMLCVQLFTAEDTLGAINLYGSRPGAFPAETHEEAMALAAHAAVALAGAQQIGNLTTAVAGRTTIGQAEGILMERFDLSPHAAFAVLVRLSSHTGHKLAVVADELVRTRTLPEVPETREGSEGSERAEGAEGAHGAAGG
jgi:GAF domain-containing protein